MIRNGRPFSGSLLFVLVLLLATANIGRSQQLAPGAPPHAPPPTNAGMPTQGGGYPAAPPINYGPSMPAPPQDASRPGGWPGGPTPQTANPPSNYPAPNYPPPNYAPPAGAPPVNYASQAPPVAPPVTVPAVPRKPLSEPPYDPALILARIGSTEVVQANEVLPSLKRYIKTIKDQHGDELAKMPEEVQRQQLEALEKDAMKKMLEDSVKIKLLVAEVRGKYPAEALKKNEDSMRKRFNEEYIKRLLANYEAASIIELENKLRELGSSVEAQRTAFIEQNMGIGWLQQQVKDEPEPTHEQMLNYYRAHATDYETPARARWERLTVKFLNFDSKDSAYRQLAQWGNEIQHGAPFGAVAKARSQDYTATDGGLNDWTVQGTLRSSEIDQALFGLPVGALSPIIEDSEGYHIIRVLERTPTIRPSFVEVQEKVREKLYDGNKEKHMTQYVDTLRERIPVWTVFDEETSVAAQPGATTR